MPDFEWRVRVYWEDTDSGGVVYYANYLKYLERARTEWLRSRGIDQSVLREETGVVMVVRSVQIEYLRSARLDDELLITVDCERPRGASMVMPQTARRAADGELLVTARIKAACLDAKSWSPCRFPERLRNAMLS